MGADRAGPGESEAKRGAIGRLFTLLVKIEMALGVFLLVGQRFLSKASPDFVETYFRSQSPIPALSEGGWIALSLSLFLASRVLLLRRVGLGRHLLLLGVVLYAIAPSTGEMPTYVGNVLAGIAVLLEGAILGLAFSRPVSEEFDREAEELSAPEQMPRVADDGENAMPRRETWGFDVLLFAHLVLYFSWYFGTDLILVDLPSEVEKHFESLRFVDPLRAWMLAYWQVWEMFFLAAAGFLFFRIDLGRKLYLVALAGLYLAPSGFFTPVSAAGSFMSYLQVLSHGAISVLFLVGPVQDEFARATAARRARERES